MSLDKSTVHRIAFLARLDIAEESIESLVEELSAILHWTKKLQEVDTTNVEPMINMGRMQLPWRVDAINDGKYPDRILSNAPESTKEFFIVPKVVE